jgi:hypothetical protein
VWIHLTEAGLRLRDQLADLPERAACDTGLTTADYEYLHDLLGRIRGNAPAATPPPER